MERKRKVKAWKGVVVVDFFPRRPRSAFKPEAQDQTFAMSHHFPGALSPPAAQLPLSLARMIRYIRSNDCHNEAGGESSRNADAKTGERGIKLVDATGRRRVSSRPVFFLSPFRPLPPFSPTSKKKIYPRGGLNSGPLAISCFFSDGK